MDNNQVTAPAHFVKTMLAIAAQRNCDTTALLKDIGIDQADIENNKPISALLYGELHHHIIELVQDEWFGMLSGGAVPNGATRLLCQTLVHCKNLEQAITRATQFFEVCRGFKIKHSHELQGRQVVIKALKLSFVEQSDFDQLVASTEPGILKSTISVWHGIHSWLIGKYIPIEDIYYTFAASDDSAPHKNSTTRYHYEQPFFGYAFDQKYLNYPIVQNEESIEDFMRKVPYYALIKKNPDEGLMPQVKVILAKSIGEEFPNAADVADSLNISVTTLHRRLGNEGTSFQKLKNESRMEAAIHYLNCPDISTAAISDLLSFENPSTFYRSFKKWTGLPPGEYRKRLLSKQAPVPD